MRQFKRVGTQMANSVNRPGVDDRRAQISSELGSITWDEVRRNRVIAGSPDACVAQIQRFGEALGLTEVVAEFNAGETIPPERIARSLDLFANQVAPAFR